MRSALCQQPCRFGRIAALLAGTTVASCHPTRQSNAAPQSAREAASEKQGANEATSKTSGNRQVDIETYIRRSWQTLRRDFSQLRQVAYDEKIAQGQADERRALVYLSPQEAASNTLQRLRKDAAGLEGVLVRVLPQRDLKPDEHGVLYLPDPYVVPGGRFNEMYGWDSYFILTGLLADGRPETLALAKAMADNALYQVKHYGTVLNANRSYYLDRSQPPFLTRMVLEVFRRTDDKRWLESSLPMLERYHRWWHQKPHLTPATGLSRYYSDNKRPAPEVLYSEKDERGRTHYQRIKAYYEAGKPVEGYNMQRYYDTNEGRLKPAFYVADRAMRESGFDPSNRFGTFNIGVTEYNPVCLNTLLYVMEVDLATIWSTVGDQKKAKAWHQTARMTAQQINAFLWDEATGLYLDYHISSKKRRNYPFATTFWPLWAGLASPKQAASIAANLGRFERQGGLLTSLTVSGSQWDAPFGWANLQQLAVAGLERYGLRREAKRIARKFRAVVKSEYQEHNAIFEKYNVVRGDSSTSAGVRFGYDSNEIGFGWTNAAYLNLGELTLLTSSAPSSLESLHQDEDS